MSRYKILTFLIMVLGKLRRRCAHHMVLYKTTPFRYVVPTRVRLTDLTDKRGILLGCCDCGLEHRYFVEYSADIRADELKIWALRPEEYDYSWRPK